jgi:site-specific recombinase XerD
MASLKQLKTQFLEYIEIEKGRSLKTVENYDHYLTRFLNFTKNDSPAGITDNSVREFRLWLNRQPSGINKAEGETLSKKTQNYYLIALRAFLKYLARQEIKSLPAERIELAKVSERTLDLITGIELARLLNSANGADLKDLRDKAILELLFSTGLRVSELCSLKSDIDLQTDELSIRGKGGKVRVVFISPDAKTAVKSYLAARKDMNDALFVHVGREVIGGEARPLHKRTVERIVKQHAVKAGISKKVTPHTMRHLFATDLLSNGADIRSVQSLLGHSSIITTQIYTHVTDKHLRDIHKKFHNKR